MCAKKCLYVYQMVVRKSAANLSQLAANFVGVFSSPAVSASCAAACMSRRLHQEPRANISLSKMVSGMAERLITTNGLALRGLLKWIDLAKPFSGAACAGCLKSRMRGTGILLVHPAVRHIAQRLNYLFTGQTRAW